MHKDLAERAHKAIINISFSIYPVNHLGEIEGQTISRKELGAANLKSKIVTVQGGSYEECVSALKEKIDGFN